MKGSSGPIRWRSHITGDARNIRPSPFLVSMRHLCARVVSSIYLFIQPVESTRTDLHYEIYECLDRRDETGRISMAITRGRNAFPVVNTCTSCVAIPAAGTRNVLRLIYRVVLWNIAIARVIDKLYIIS